MARRAAPSVWTVVLAAALTSLVVTRPNEVLRTLSSLLAAAQKATDPGTAPAKAPAPLAVDHGTGAPSDPHVERAQAVTVPAFPALTPPTPPIPYDIPHLEFVAAGGQPVDLTTRLQATSSTTAAVTRAQSVRIKVDVSASRNPNSQFVLLGEDDVVLPFLDPNGAGPVEELSISKFSSDTATITVPLPPDLPKSRLSFRGRMDVDPQQKLVERTHGSSPSSRPLALDVDRVGPQLRSVLYDDTRKGTTQVTLAVNFADDDLVVTPSQAPASTPAPAAAPDAAATRAADSTPGATAATPSTPASATAKATETNLPGLGWIRLLRRNIDLDRTEPVGGYTVTLDTARPDRVFLDFAAPLAPGDYTLTLTEGIAPEERVKDLAGNPAGTFVDPAGQTGFEPQVVRFSVFPPSRTGLQVEFPQFTPPKIEGDRERPFNPDDYVITRVARLYYMRDAHRVAQIINRNVRSYNQAAVTQSERAAENARELANELVDDRRAAERAAVRAAEELRRLEGQLAESQSDLEGRALTADQLQDVKDQIARNTEEQNRITEQLKSPTVDEQPRLLERQQQLVLQAAELKRNEADLQRRVDARSESAITDQIGQIQGQIRTQRQTMIAAQEKLDVAQAKEDRQVQDAFLKEVAAAKADPDTYAPGKIDSVDPVTQVSISVIGEGLIQLRGPTKGVNKIRTMINQIDAPLGQVKVGIFTVQINGERGDRMERVARRIEGQVDVSRFLTSHSLMLMRRSVVEVASEIAARAYAEFDGHTQIDRDRRYLYAFFGRDFVDSLFAMDSEFLFTGNRLLSLNSMDNISLNRALFILALAKNDVRRCILERFMEHVTCDLPQAEYDYRIATRIDNPGKHLMKKVHEEVMNRYIFRNFRSVFETEIVGDDTINPMQLEFLRLAQIFKSQMVAEVELKQRIVERGLIQDRSNDETAEFEVLDDVQRAIREEIRTMLLNYTRRSDDFRVALADVRKVLATVPADVEFASKLALDTSREIERLQQAGLLPEARQKIVESEFQFDKIKSILVEYRNLLNPDDQSNLANFLESDFDALRTSNDRDDIADFVQLHTTLAFMLRSNADRIKKGASDLLDAFRAYETVVDRLNSVINQAIGDTVRGARTAALDTIAEEYRNTLLCLQALAARAAPSSQRDSFLNQLVEFDELVRGGLSAVDRLHRAVVLKSSTRADVDHRKLLDHLIDEREEKYIELVEGTRAYTANIDAYLKRLVVALEDDCRIQYYDPAFERIRGAAREYDVQLGQVERTTVLTNNRQLAKVEPTATMEFDLPKRDIVITEAMKGAKALVQDYGALLQDPTFLAATSLLSGSPPTAGFSSPMPPVPGLPNEGFASPLVKDVLPPLPTSPPQQMFNLYGQPQPAIGANLAALIPDPAVYKFETGTGFEIRPVIQPDGDSVIYDFNYMYTTNVREPVRADEKHLGRVKRHFLNTQVQTSTYELRELSRYTVALKAARTSRGVPLFEDIPGLGILFRPLPSAESSLQQNIILGQSTVYPTLFDLMGLRWAPYVVDLDDEHLVEEEFVVRGRRKTVTDWAFDEASRRHDEFLRIGDNPQLLRPDLYRTQERPSRIHPNGFEAPRWYGDPTGQRFRVPDSRPPEYRIPPADPFTGMVDRTPAPPYQPPPIYPGPDDPQPMLPDDPIPSVLPPSGLFSLPPDPGEAMPLPEDYIPIERREFEAIPSPLPGESRALPSFTPVTEGARSAEPGSATAVRGASGLAQRSNASIPGNLDPRARRTSISPSGATPRTSPTSTPVRQQTPSAVAAPPERKRLQVPTRQDQPDPRPSLLSRFRRR
jgi:hypothetical protein